MSDGVFFRMDEENNWERSGIFKNQDDIIINLGFVIPGNMISYKDKIVYDLPEAIFIKKRESGNIYSDKNEKIGRYILNKNGKLRLFYNREFIDGKDLEGHIQIKAKISLEKGKESVKLNFGKRIGFIDVYNNAEFKTLCFENDEIKVKAEYADSVFPKETDIKAQIVRDDSEEYKEDIEEALRLMEEKDIPSEDTMFFDISFMNDGKEIEPDGKVKIQIDFPESEAKETDYKEEIIDENRKIELVHIKENAYGEKSIELLGDEKETDIKLNKDSEVETISFESKNFSLYGIVIEDHIDLNEDGKLEIRFCDKNTDIEVDYNTDKSEIIKKINEEYEAEVLGKSENNIVKIDVKSWKEYPAYNGEKPGEYKFIAKDVDLTDDYKDEYEKYEKVYLDKPERKIIVKEKAIVGTEDKPYIISDVNSLNKLAEQVNEGILKPTKDFYAELSCDIDFKGQEFKGIGYKDKKTKNGFQGHFDGKGYKISNINIRENYAGIFSYIKGDTEIRNLIIASGNIGTKETSSYAAGIAAYIDSGKTIIEDCINMASVDSKIYTAGIAAYVNSDKTVIKNCINKAKVESKGDAAGIAAYVNGITIDGCINEADISGEKNVAGITGNSGSKKSNIKNSVNRGNIKSFGSNDNVAGIAAKISGTLENLTNEGEILAEKKTSSCGGIVGELESGSKIEKSINIGKIKSKSKNTGGIVGLCKRESEKPSSIICCFNTASVENGYGIIGDLGYSKNWKKKGILEIKNSWSFEKCFKNMEAVNDENKSSVFINSFYISDDINNYTVNSEEAESGILTCKLNKGLHTPVWTIGSVKSDLVSKPVKAAVYIDEKNKPVYAINLINVGREEYGQLRAVPCSYEGEEVEIILEKPEGDEREFIINYSENNKVNLTNNKFIMPSSNVDIEYTIIPSLKNGEKFKVKFFMENPEKVENAKIYKEIELTVPDNRIKKSEVNDPEKEGYIFKGWCISKSKRSFSFDDDVTEDMDIYPQWDIEKFSIKFDSDGGSKTDEQEVEWNEKIKRPKDPRKDGYEFNGWFEKGSNERFNFDISIKSDKNLKASWKASDIKQVFHYNVEGVENIEKTVHLEEKAAIASLSDAIKIKKPGEKPIWYTSENFEEEFDFTRPLKWKDIDDKENLILNIYARWVKDIDISDDWYKENADELYISNENDMLAFAEALKAEKSFEGKTVALKEDVNLGNIDWDPLTFKDGIFDGDNHIISGIYIKRPESEKQAFFKEIKNATIRNLILEGSIEAKSKIAGLAVNVEDGKIENVENRIKLLGSGVELAGIAIDFSGTISNSKNTADLNFDENKDKKSIAGVILNGKSGIAKNCVNSGNIAMSSQRNKKSELAGICLYGEKGFKISNCKNEGKLSENGTGFNTGYVSGISHEAYLIDGCRNEGNIKGNAGNAGITYKSMEFLENCVNEGVVEGSRGLIAGIACHATGEVISCENNGKFCVKAGANQKLGGIVAEIERTKKLSIFNCVNKSDIEFEEKAKVSCLGGIVAKLDNSGVADIRRCINYTSFNDSIKVNADRNGSSAVAGIVASNYSSENLIIQECVNLGNFYNVKNTSSNVANAAGILGFNNSKNLDISYNYNRGDFKFTDDFHGRFGGITGGIEQEDNVKIRKMHSNYSTAKMDISMDNKKGDKYKDWRNNYGSIGEVLQFADKESFKKNFYNIENCSVGIAGMKTSKQKVREYSKEENKKLAKSEEEMKDDTFVLDLSELYFAKDTENKNDGYPVLLWQGGDKVEGKIRVRYYKDDDIIEKYFEKNSQAEEIKPEKKWYRYGGWYLDKELKEKFDFSKELTENIDLYIKWDESVLKAEYFEDVENKKSFIEQKYTKDKSLVTSPDNNPIKAGHMFIGWYEGHEDEDGAIILCDEPFKFRTEIKSDLKLFAKWQESKLDFTPFKKYNDTGMFRIKNIEQMNAFSELVNATVSEKELIDEEIINEGEKVKVFDFKDKKIILDNDIDFSLQEFRPVGSEKSPFRGEFDGNNKKISNIRFISGIEQKGIFGYAEKATIENIIIESGDIKENISEKCNIASVVGKIKDTNIVNCSNNADISSKGSNKYAGGIVAMAEGRCYIVDCINNGKISAYIEGGILAKGDGRITLRNCVNNGIMKTLYEAGGIVSELAGKDQNTAVIECCRNNGDILYSANPINYGSIAGIVGTAGKIRCACTVRYCYNTGNITGTECGNAENLDKAAGIICTINDKKSKLYSSFNVGEVTGRKNDGIVVERNSENIKNTFSLGTDSDDSITAEKFNRPERIFVLNKDTDDRYRPIYKLGENHPEFAGEDGKDAVISAEINKSDDGKIYVNGNEIKFDENEREKNIYLKALDEINIRAEGNSEDTVCTHVSIKDGREKALECTNENGVYKANLPADNIKVNCRFDKKENMIKLIFKSGQGIFEDESTDDKCFDISEAGKFSSENIPKISREGFLFDYWKEEGTDDKFNFDTVIVKKTVLVPHWKKEGYVTVIFNANGGYFEDNKKSISYETKKGNHIKEPESEILNEKLRLKGWSKDKVWKKTSKYWSFDDPVENDMTLYAVWGRLEGIGTKENPYICSEGGDIDIINSMISSGETFSNKYFEIKDDITLENSIGSAGRSFEGHITAKDGVKVELDGANSFVYELGKDGCIENINIIGDVSDENIGKCNYCGAIAGVVSGEVNNCHVEADMNVSSPVEDGLTAPIKYVGGLFGKVNKGAKIKDVSYKGNIDVKLPKERFYIGGFSGESNVKIAGVSVEGSITSAGSLNSDSMIGGITGRSLKDIENCSSKMTINSEIKYHVAGIAGFIASRDAIIKNCVNEGTITGTEEAAGILGSALGDANTKRVVSSENRGYINAKKARGLCIGGKVINSFSYSDGKTLAADFMENSYYLSESPESHSNGGRTREEFESGEVAWELEHNGASEWGQNIPDDIYPVKKHKNVCRVVLNKTVGGKISVLRSYYNIGDKVIIDVETDENYELETIEPGVEFIINKDTVVEASFKPEEDEKKSENSSGGHGSGSGKGNSSANGTGTGDGSGTGSGIGTGNGEGAGSGDGAGIGNIGTDKGSGSGNSGSRERGSSRHEKDNNADIYSDSKSISYEETDEKIEDSLDIEENNKKIFKEQTGGGQGGGGGDISGAGDLKLEEKTLDNKKSQTHKIFEVSEIADTIKKNPLASAVIILTLISIISLSAFGRYKAYKKETEED